MRLNQYRKARKRFLKAIEIDPSFQIPRDNLRDLDRFLHGRGQQQHHHSRDRDNWFAAPRRQQRHNLQCMRALSHQDFLDLNTFFNVIMNDRLHGGHESNGTHTSEEEHMCAKDKFNKTTSTLDKEVNQMRSYVQAILRSPFIVRDSYALFHTTAQRVSSVIINDSFLTAHYGHHTADFYPHNMVEEDSHPYLLSLEHALDQLLTYPKEIYMHVDASEPGTYIQWNVNEAVWIDLWDRLQTTSTGSNSSSMLASLDSRGSGTLDTSRDRFLPLTLFSSDSWIQSCFHSSSVVSERSMDIDGRDDAAAASANAHRSGRHNLNTDISTFYLQTHWQMLLIGESGAGMFNHQDTLRSSSWQLQLKGRKRWHVCDPDQSRFLYRAGDVDMFDPDYEAYPLVLNATCYDEVLEPGDMIYYPHAYWHQTLNLDTPTISITGTIVTPSNYRLLMEDLKSECGGKRRVFVPDERICSKLERCFLLWEQLYS